MATQFEIHSRHRPLQRNLGDANDRRLLADERHSTRLSPFVASLRSCVTRLLLTADGEHKHRIKFCNVSIECDIAACAAPDHQLPKVRSGKPTDQRIAFQHIECPYDVLNTRWRIRHLMRKEMF